MTTDPIRNPFATLDPADIERLRKIFERHNYSEKAVQEVLPKCLDGFANSEGAGPVVQRALRENTPLNTLVRLCLVGLSEEEAVVREVLGESLLSDLLAGGLFERTAKGIRCPFIIYPVRGFYIVYDHLSAKHSEISKFMVMGVGTSSLAPANAAPRRHYRRALDMGCGGGFQSFQLARHCDEVVGLDINPRALSMARFSAVLNRMDNIDFRMSDFFSAVEGEKFDLIVSNPPFVISPESEYHYRDGGLGADRVAETVIRNAGKYLEEGGVAVIICEWASLKENNAIDRLRQWVDGSGCDLWVSTSKQADLVAYAMSWIRSYQQHLSAEEYAKTYDRWLDYYEKLGMDGVQTGLIAMRKRDGQNWFFADEAPSVIRGRWGETLLQLLEIHTLLNTASIDEILDQPYQLSSAARMRHIYQQTGTRWASAEAEIFLEDPLPYSGRVDQYTAGLLSRCDGTAPLRQLVAGMGEAVGVSFPEIVEAAMPILHGLMQRGYLIPVSLLPPSQEATPE
jgi:tRNA1(Val) A37 N6-methylase TrmN6